MQTPKPASEADLKALAVELFLAVSRVQNQVTAIGRILRDREILRKDEFYAALLQADEETREARENLERAGSLGPIIELLRKSEPQG